MPDAGCPFCDRVVSGRIPEGHCSTKWECPCGAIAVGAPPFDLDEAADQLLDHLGLDARVSEPVTPVGTSGLLYAQRYDASKVSRAIGDVLSRSGYEVRVTDEITQTKRPDGTPMDWTTRIIWARPRGTDPGS
jgi:hypothetical protein